MNRWIWTVLLGCVGLALSGCGGGLAGSYSVTAVVPESARGDFEFGRIIFERDGDFTADVSYAGKPQEHRGTYTYDASSQRLTFTGQDGRVRAYRAELCCDGRNCREVHVWNDGDRKEWIALLRRE